MYRIESRNSLLISSVFEMKEQINEGLDKAIMTMKKGEEAIVKVSSEFLQKFEGENLGSTALFSSVLLYEVRLIDFVKVI